MKRIREYIRNQKQHFIVVFTIVLINLLVFKCTILIGFVPSGSMEPTLKTNSYHIMYTLPYLLDDPVPERGDIICFKSSSADGKNKFLVKRVIGIEGDIICFKAGEIFVNDELLKEPYLNEQLTLNCGSSSTYTVPEGCVFVLGDNRQHSHDSRFWDNPYVNVSSIKGTLLR